MTKEIKRARKKLVYAVQTNKYVRFYREFLEVMTDKFNNPTINEVACE